MFSQFFLFCSHVVHQFLYGCVLMCSCVFSIVRTLFYFYVYDVFRQFLYVFCFCCLLSLVCFLIFAMLYIFLMCSCFSLVSIRLFFFVRKCFFLFFVRCVFSPALFASVVSSSYTLYLCIRMRLLSIVRMFALNLLYVFSLCV